MVGVLGLSGCSLPERTAGFDSVDPCERTLALGRAAEHEDKECVPALIGLLDSEDPAERMLAICLLEKKTGQTLGYEYSASEWERSQAIERWVAWRRGSEQGSATGGGQ